MPLPIALAAKKIGQQVVKKAVKKTAKKAATKQPKKKGTWWKVAACVVVLGIIAQQVTLNMILGMGQIIGGIGAAQAADTPDDCSPTGVVPVSNEGSNVATAVKYLQDVGLSLPQAAGIIGNFQQESGPNLDPTARNSGGYQGIAQWDPNDRWPKLEAFVATIHKSPTTIDGQLRYVGWELGFAKWSGHPSPYKAVTASLKKTSTPAAAAKVFFDKYEGAGDSTLPKRQANAESVYNKFKKQAAGVQPADFKQNLAATDTVADEKVCDGSDAGDVGALQATVKSYAWPTSHPDGHLAQTAGYSKAVKTATIQGRYVGHMPNPTPPSRPDGDDCGAFVTTLMVDSGWDTSYNHSAKISAGAGNTTTQEAWLKKNWKPLGAASQLSIKDLQPGDVGISTTGGLQHTWVYVGKIPGFQGVFAEASQAGGSIIGYAPQARQSSSTLYANFSGAHYYRRKAPPASSKWVNPLKTHHAISSPFGWRNNPGQGGKHLFHYGDDIPVPVGTPIVSACTGNVVSENDEVAWGGFVTTVSCGGNWYTLYMHQSKFIAKVGDHVKAGQKIGLSGGKAGAIGSGDSTGPHLHFQVQRGSGQATTKTAVDPALFMAQRGAPL